MKVNRMNIKMNITEQNFKKSPIRADIIKKYLF
jgi:hypothetical protein